MTKAFAFDLMGVIFPESHLTRNILCPMFGLDYEKTKAAYKEYARGKIGGQRFIKTVGISRAQEKRFH